jgi:hypothetical protein
VVEREADAPAIAEAEPSAVVERETEAGSIAEGDSAAQVEEDETAAGAAEGASLPVSPAAGSVARDETQEEDAGSPASEPSAEPDAEDKDTPESGAVTDEPDVDFEILPVEDSEDDSDGDDGYEDEEEERPAGFDKRPDVFSWVLAPVMTMAVGPGLAALIGLFVAERTSGYPEVCAAVESTNGCEETLLRMAAQHAVAFLALWVLLWALPWWRGLRAYRIGLAVVTALILIAVPLRLIATIQLGDA